MSDARLREFRFRNSTTFQTAHTNAATDYWNTDNSVKLQLTAHDLSGLTREGLEDETLKTRLHQKGAPTPGLAKGELPFSAYLCGAESDLTEGPTIGLLKSICGGKAAPTTGRSTVALGGSTPTNIAFDWSLANVVAGQAVLVGVRGDARGMGEVKPINAVGANWIGLTLACNAAVSAGDNLVFSDTVHYDEDAAQQYFETLSIGRATADQRQTIGAGATFGMSLDAGERPTIDVTLLASDHRHVPANERASFSHDVDPESGTPAFSKAIGLFHMGDYGDTTRTARKAGDFTFEPGLELEEQPDPAGNNGVGGYEQVMSTPTLEVSMLYDEDMLGLADDFEAETEKMALLQLGHEATKCVAIELSSCFIDALPEDVTLGNLAAVKVMVHGDEDFVDGDEIRSSVYKVHHF